MAPAERSTTLVYWLAGSNWEMRTRLFTAVELKVSNGRLTAWAYSPRFDGGEDVPMENWKCEDGRLLGMPPLPTSSEGHAILHVSGSIVLERAVDRALVVHVRSRESGVSMIVPFRETNESWFVYPAEGSETGANTSLERTRER
jgi:hypothetical protein